MKLIIDIPDEAYDKLLKEQHLPDGIDLEYFVIHGKPLNDTLQSARREIEEKYGSYAICEWFEDYDYEENDISEYRPTGDSINDILGVIDNHVFGANNEQKHWYAVGLSAEGDSSGYVQLTESEAIAVRYATDENNWKKLESEPWNGNFFIDTEHLLEKLP